MVGGKGTRLGSLTAEIPKPMILVDGKPILEHQIECLKRSGIDKVLLMTGHLGSKIVDYFGNGENFGVAIEYFHEDEPLGSGGALSYIRDRVEDDFVLLYGDVFLDVDFKKMLEFHRQNKAEITLFAHPNSHPFDSDLVLEKNSQVTGWDHKDNVRDYDYKNLVNAGIYIFSKEALAGIQTGKQDLEKDIIAKLTQHGRVFAYKSSEYAKDMGTPERLESVSKDYKNQIPLSRNLQNKQKCIFLDRDGTINIDYGHISSPDQIELLPHAAEAIRLINQSDYICVVVTNQPVIARGMCSFDDMDKIHSRLETLLGKEHAYVDDIFFCPHHPHKGFEGEVPELKIDCECRKPKSGMFLDAQAKYNIDFTESYIIGDGTRDMEAGQRLGMKTVLVKTGEAGLDGIHDVIPDFEAEDILAAVQLILQTEG